MVVCSLRAELYLDQVLPLLEVGFPTVDRKSYGLHRCFHQKLKQGLIWTQGNGAVVSALKPRMCSKAWESRLSQVYAYIHIYVQKCQIIYMIYRTLWVQDPIPPTFSKTATPAVKIEIVGFTGLRLCLRRLNPTGRRPPPVCWLPGLLPLLE